MRFLPSQRWRGLSALLPTSVTVAILLLAVCPVPCQAGTVQQITDQRDTTVPIGIGFTSAPTGSLDDAGTVIYANATTNQLGGNPEHLFQIFRFDAATAAGQQITSFKKGVSNRPGTVSVSDDGQWIAFVSKADPVGQNHDASPEVFVMHPDGSGLTQVTNDPSVTAPGVTAAVLSGSANRVAFRSRGNFLGTNPSNREQVYVVNVDGTQMKQLTSVTTSETWWGTSISDDGQQIVFGTTADLLGGNADKSREVYAIQADGTNLRQITSSPSDNSQVPVLSGDGSKIAFESGNNRDIYVINWNGTGLRVLSSSITGQKSGPSITDDGQFVFFSAVGPSTAKTEIWKVKTDATGLTQLTSAVGSALTAPCVAGGGGRVAFAGTVQPTTSSGISGELGVMTGTGTNRLQLIVTMTRSISTPALTRDGTRIVFSANIDPFGTNPEGDSEVFRIQADGTGLFQVTSGGGYYPTITADGNTIVFESTADLGGQNPTHAHEIFRINADGTGVQRLTYSSGSAFEPKIAANGSVVVFYTFPNFQIEVVNADGSFQQSLTAPGASSLVPSVDDTGTWIAFMSSGNLTGDSPNGVNQIYRIRTDGNGLQRISTDPTRHEFYPEISGTGTRIVYMSSADPVGSNPNHFDQLFTYDAATSQTRQVTAGTGMGTAALPAAISGDGNWVVWLATANWAEPNPMFNLNLYRVPATGGAPERIGAGSTSFSGGTGSGFNAVLRPHADMTATRVVLGGGDDPTGQNGDYSSDLWTVDMAKEPEIRVSPTAPTLVSWDYEAGPIRYDVIRGDVDNLAPGPSGTVDLGPVTCLENDSPDTDTRGFEDAVTPPPGHAFFFLFRGSHGLNFGPGSWGQSSAGAERAPGTGVCAP